MSIVFP